MGTVNYWGGMNGDLISVLRKEGHTVYAPSLGPVSSNWE